jgi:hypothetical protein
MGLSCHPLNARLGFSQDRRCSGADKEELRAKRAKGPGRNTAGLRQIFHGHALHRRPSPARLFAPRCPENSGKTDQEQGRARSLPRCLSHPDYAFSLLPKTPEGGGAPRGAILIRCPRTSAWPAAGALRRATCGIFLEPRIAAYHQWHRCAHGDPASYPTAHALQRRRANWRPPRPVRYAMARWSGPIGNFVSEISPSLPRRPGRRTSSRRHERLARTPLQKDEVVAFYGRFGERG